MVVPVRWRPDEVITLEVWITNAGITRTAQHSLTVPRPPQPYPSWTWNGVRHVPPFPPPDDGRDHDWDEAGQDWVPM